MTSASFFFLHFCTTPCASATATQSDAKHKRLNRLSIATTAAKSHFVHSQWRSFPSNWLNKQQPLPLFLKITLKLLSPRCNKKQATFTNHPLTGLFSAMYKQLWAACKSPPHPTPGCDNVYICSSRLVSPPHTFRIVGGEDFAAVTSIVQCVCF